MLLVLLTSKKVKTSIIIEFNIILLIWNKIYMILIYYGEREHVWKWMFFHYFFYEKKRFQTRSIQYYLLKLVICICVCSFHNMIRSWFSLIKKSRNNNKKKIASKLLKNIFKDQRCQTRSYICFSMKLNLSFKNNIKMFLLCLFNFLMTSYHDYAYIILIVKILCV